MTTACGKSVGRWRRALAKYKRKPSSNKNPFAEPDPGELICIGTRDRKLIDPHRSCIGWIEGRTGEG